MTLPEGDPSLGRALRAQRHERGLTLVQVAAAAGLSQPFLSQLELGRTRPSMRSLFRIAGALGTTQQALLARAAGPVGGSAVEGEARLLLHTPGADLTELSALPGGFEEFYRHDRRELLYVVRGTVEVELGEPAARSTVLVPRETMTVEGGVPHRFRRVGPERAVLLMVHTGDTAGA